MPFASISKVTSICGTPRGAGGMPSKLKLPSDLLSRAILRSPWKIAIVTAGWLSAAVENTCDFLHGIVVLRSMIGVSTPPSVSMPSVSGVTSRRSTSFTSPFRMPPWIAAPMATTSSGLTPLCGSLPKISFAFSCRSGMRVWPPTSTTSSTVESPASFRHLRHGSSVRFTRSEASASSLARVSVICRCFGPVASAVMNGRLMSYVVAVERAHFAFSASSFRRCNAMTSLPRSMPCCALKSAIIHFMTAWSMSSPPKWVSPFVAFTSKTPSPISRMEISNVPPPKSNTAIFSFFFLSRPYASEAAVGSLTMRFTSRPAMRPASFVAWRCWSLKYAGTVMTASVIFSPRYASASSFSLRSTIAEISCAV